MLDQQSTVEPFELSAVLRREIRRLSRLRPWRSGMAIAGDWLVIVGCFAAACSVPNPAVWLLAALLIATRQHALGILMHDAAHHRLLRHREWNDRLANWLLAYPLLTTVAGYRCHHLAHHLHLNTADDPDWLRKQGEDWEFPKTRRGLLCLLLRDLCGGGAVEMVRAARHFRKAAPPTPALARLGRLFYYVLVAVAVTLAGLWVEVLLLWFVPLFTLFPTLMRVRSIAEHSALPGRHDLDMTRNVLAPWWERFLFVPHNVHYHLDHHLFPSVPFYRLPELHRLLQHMPDYARSAHQNDSLLGLSSGSVLHDLTAEALPSPGRRAGAVEVLTEATPPRTNHLTSHRASCPGAGEGVVTTFMLDPPTETQAHGFRYEAAFARNLGLLTEAEQERLRHSRVAIAGLGGVGGIHLITLARLGIGRFTIADPDRFELANFNRQQGAVVSALDRNKAEVMARQARDINPELDIRLFAEAVTPANVADFLEGVDVLVDGIDFFAIAARRLLFREARRRGIWAVTAGPLGYSTAWLVFDPNGMSFDDYFDLREGQSPMEQLVAFAVGLAPRATHLGYLDLARVDVRRRCGPSAGLACQLCAGVAAAEVVKILLGRGPLQAAPCYFQFDAYRQMFRRGCLWGGNRHPWQRLKRWWLRRQLCGQLQFLDGDPQ